MKSTYRLIWTKEARENLLEILSYLRENWTEREVDAFIELLNHQLRLISLSPMSFPRTNNKNIRKAVLKKQVSTYYEIRRSEIYILLIFDNRQNPNKLKFD